MESLIGLKDDQRSTARLALSSKRVGRVGFRRIIVPEVEAPNMLAIPV